MEISGIIINSRYRILTKLGEGGMAVVYKARDIELEREVAVKLLKPEKAITEKALKRFNREAKALAKLDHDNIIPVIDYGEYEGNPYLVMPYIAGGTLKERLGGRIRYDEAAKILKPIANALGYAHKYGIIHRDIKPTNILMGENGKPMLSDFGVAKILEMEETAELTETGIGIGTPEYMSPEQAMGEVVDGRTDCYAMGIVLYEMITGQRPFRADTPLAIAIKQSTEALPNPRKYVPELPEKVEQVLRKALAKKAVDRYQTMEEFEEALGEIAEGKLKESRKRYVEKPAGSRLKCYWLGISGVVVVLAVLGIIWFSPGQESMAMIAKEFPTTNTETGAEDKVGTPQATDLITPFPPTNTPTIMPTPTLGVGSKLTLEDGMQMVFIPAGEFLMGSKEGIGNSDEHPQHTVFLDSYWIDQTEVTNSMYLACLKAGICPQRYYYQTDDFDNPKYLDFPARDISHEDAVKYCQWVGKRLPTEAEWEKAAGGGQGYTFPWGNDFPNASLVNFDNNLGGTTKVGTYPEGASDYGALDMAGNVWEWVADKYLAYYYSESPINNPQGPTYEGLTQFVSRGGAYSSSGQTIRISARIMPNENIAALIGFRCALSAQ